MLFVTICINAGGDSKAAAPGRGPWRRGHSAWVKSQNTQAYFCRHPHSFLASNLLPQDQHEEHLLLSCVELLQHAVAFAPGLGLPPRSLGTFYLESFYVSVCLLADFFSFFPLQPPLLSPLIFFFFVSFCVSFTRYLYRLDEVPEGTLASRMYVTCFSEWGFLKTLSGWSTRLIFMWLQGIKKNVFSNKDLIQEINNHLL